MTIINTFISDENVKIPQYTYYSLRLLREKNKYKDIYFISNIGHGFDKIFENLNIKWINQNDIPISKEMEALEESSNIDHLMGTPDTKYKSPPKFFFRALQRIFYLESFARWKNITNFYHTENDVLTFYKLPDKLTGSYVTPMGPGISTFAFCFFETPDIIKSICTIFLSLLELGETKFKQQYSVDMMNEMTMLAVAKDKIDNLKYLPILPSENIEFVFDPGSYGQFLFGTNNHDHDVGYAGNHHYIGKQIIQNKLNIMIKNGFPYCNNTKIFNLHIHSKNLVEVYDKYKLYNG